MTEKETLNVLEPMAMDECNALPVGEVVIGELVGLSSTGEPLVDFIMNRQAQPLIALSTVSLTQRHVGRKVALMFLDGSLRKPLVVGLIYSPLEEIIENFELAAIQKDALDRNADFQSSSGNIGADSDMHVDGRKVVLEAQEEVVFKCGDASITLNKSGKISIRGKYILNRATGVNRILGGSVQVN